MTGLWLTDESGVARESFAAGETVLAAGAGLQPGLLYEFRLDAPGASSGVLLARLSADRHGTLHPTVLLPHLGLTEPGRDGAILHRSFDEADKALGGRTLTMHAGEAGKPATALKLAVAAGSKHPQVMASDGRGKLLTGCVRGETDVVRRIAQFPRPMRQDLSRSPPVPLAGGRSDRSRPAARRLRRAIVTALVPADGRLVQRLVVARRDPPRQLSS